MKKTIARSVTLALMAVVLAAAFTGCAILDILLGGNDGRLSAKAANNYFPNGLCAAREAADTKAGYINNKGEWKIAAQFDIAMPFMGGAAAVGTADAATPKMEMWMINTKGAKLSSSYTVIAPRSYAVNDKDMSKVFYRGTAFSFANFMEAYGSTEADEIFSKATADIINTKGKRVYTSTNNKIEGNIGEALIINNGETDPANIKYGAVSVITGKEILPVTYDDIDEIESISGKFRNQTGSFLAIGKKDGETDPVKYGIATTKGKVLAAPKYENVGDFYYGVAQARTPTVTAEGKTTYTVDYINTSGKVILSYNKEADWTSADFGNFDSKSLTARNYTKDGKLYSFVFNKKGDTIVSGEREGMKGTYAFHYTDSNFIVKSDTGEDGKSTVTVHDIKGKQLQAYANDLMSSTTYTYVDARTHFGIAAKEQTETSYSTAMYDGKGKATGAVIVSESFTPNFNVWGLATITVKNGENTERKLINLKNEVLVDKIYGDPDYSLVKDYKDVDAIKFTLEAETSGDSKYGYVNSKGKIILEPKNEKVGEYYGGSLFLIGEKDAEDNWKYGFADKTGAAKISAKYDEAEPFVNGFAKVGNKNSDGDMRYGFINTKGEEAVPAKFAELEITYAGSMYFLIYLMLI